MLSGNLLISVVLAVDLTCEDKRLGGDVLEADKRSGAIREEVITFKVIGTGSEIRKRFDVGELE